jgi:hypothetical protein
MSVHARRCEGCGGPLPEAPANSPTITCEFCGVVHEVSSSAPIIVAAGADSIAPRPQVKGSIFPWP